MARHTITLAVTVTAEGSYYSDAADLENHVSGWIYDALEDRDDLREQSVTDPATLTAAAYRQAADDINTSERLRDWTDDHMSDINEAAAYLRRRADEIETGAQQ